MVYRFAWAFALMLQVSAAMAMDMRSTVPQQVQEPSVCWDPDVEFPVPCDDED